MTGKFFRSAILVLVCANGLTSFAQGQPALARAAEQAGKGNCAGAVATLTSLLAANAKAGEEPYGLLAWCFEQQGQMEKAVQLLRTGLRNFPQSALLARNLGQALFRQRTDSPEAGELLARAANTRNRRSQRAGDSQGATHQTSLGSTDTGSSQTGMGQPESSSRGGRRTVIQVIVILSSPP